MQSVRPSVHPQVDVVSQKRKKVEWGITNELVLRPSSGQVRSGGGEGGEGEAASVCMGICHPYQSDRRPSSKDRKPQRTTQKFSPGYIFRFRKSSFDPIFLCPFLQIIRLLPSTAEFIQLPSSDLETQEPAIAGGRARHTPTRKLSNCAAAHFTSPPGETGRQTDRQTEVERERERATEMSGGGERREGDRHRLRYYSPLSIESR